eukprot:1176419-Prorocentrum_minimum.AAC.2
MVVSDEILEKSSKIRGLYDIQAITNDQWLSLRAEIFESFETEGNTAVVDDSLLKSTSVAEESIDSNQLTPAIAARDPSSSSSTPERKYAQKLDIATAKEFASLLAVFSLRGVAAAGITSGDGGGPAAVPGRHGGQPGAGLAHVHQSESGGREEPGPAVQRVRQPGRDGVPDLHPAAHSGRHLLRAGTEGVRAECASAAAERGGLLHAGTT